MLHFGDLWIPTTIHLNGKGIEKPYLILKLGRREWSFGFLCQFFFVSFYSWDLFVRSDQFYCWSFRFRFFFLSFESKCGTMTTALLLFMITIPITNPIIFNSPFSMRSMMISWHFVRGCCFLSISLRQN